MDASEAQYVDSPPLDPSLAPLLLFPSVHDDDDAESGDEETTTHDGRTSTFLYSIPKRQLVPSAAGLDYLTTSDAAVVSWIKPQGWVLTLDPVTRDASLRDPFSSRTVRLPRDRERLLPVASKSNRRRRRPPHTTSRCLLSTRRPTDPGCVVLVIHLKDPVLWHCSAAAGTAGRWSRHEYPPELIAGAGSDRGLAMWAVSLLTAARGRFYTSVFDAEDRLVTLEFSPAAGPVFSTARAAAPTPRWLPGCFRAGLVESCGDLFAVWFSLEPFRGVGLVDIHVYKLVVSDDDENAAAWVKVAGLGDDRVFFFDRGMVGASMPADDEVGFKANCIYFTNEDDKGLYVYDMERGSISLRNPGSDVPDCSEPMLLMHST